MLIAYLTLFSGLFISAVAIYYSVSGLTAIFSAAMIPIIVMGVTLEVAKLVATVWIKQNWKQAPGFMKTYMLTAVAILMFITSLGIFGFLSKAHSDQSLVSGDVQSKLAIYDEKINTAKENIEADRKQLKQMDEAVDQVMARSTSEAGASRANAIRKSQQRDRTALAKSIETNQKLIASLNDEAAPIRAEIRKVEAEVGPIKYIAKFIYGDNPDANILEKAVTWVIILIVIVFDPLAVILLLASQYSFAWKKEETIETIPVLEEVVKEEPPEELIEEPVVEETTPPVPMSDPDHEEADNDVIIVNINPEPEPVVEEEPDEDYGVERPGDYLNDDIKITHTSTSTIIEDSAGIQEIPITPSLPPGYVMGNGQIFKISKDANHITDKIPEDATYVQNEEQQESGKWSSILNRPISEEEYIRTSQDKKGSNDQ